MTQALDFAPIGRRAKSAARLIAQATSAKKNEALIAMATALERHAPDILVANQSDLEAAQARSTPPAMMDRLTLTRERINGMAQGLREVAQQSDPVGEVVSSWARPNGLSISQVRIPLGVIGIIYEARPNVTADAAALCLKSGNAVVLRGGSEAQHSNQAILQLLRSALRETGLPEDALLGFPTAERGWVAGMLKADQYLDVIIPRGGESLIRYVTEASTVPVIKHYKGVCHVYVDEAADLEKAHDIALNAKVQRPGVCNAMETLLVHTAVADTFLPTVGRTLQEAHVELRGCERSQRILPGIEKATADDYHAEYLALILAVRVVDSLNDAIEHIDEFGSDHTECIVSEDQGAVTQFLNEIQSSVVIANASTRFSDGGQMGLGAEIGISTSRLHAYGPMGAVDLTTKKYIINGSGQVRN
ncbi:MAG: glutamate-5-semialdehyde dehydrogenase [Myxococcota bacterium]|nr:glutamate-5-semialdehyde dehydrogenase [Myxococcota bacterium]